MKTAEQTAGKRVLDVLDIHWYSEAEGGGVRITADNDTAAVVAVRVQAPRSLWDPTYDEGSWITQPWFRNGAVALIPWLRDKIAARYPGTKIAITATEDARTSPEALPWPTRSASSAEKAYLPRRCGK
jgi:hypothetical protein